MIKLITKILIALGIKERPSVDRHKIKGVSLSIPGIEPLPKLKEKSNS